MPKMTGRCREAAGVILGRIGPVVARAGLIAPLARRRGAFLIDFWPAKKLLAVANVFSKMPLYESELKGLD